MKVAGIICEYNPLHNGHIYQLEQTRKTATHIVCVMSGNFVQRGDLAIADKWSRAKAAILSGADLVVELPTAWACSSAEDFARGGIYILSCLGVDMLSFGCENDSVELLIASAEAVDSPNVGEIIKKEMVGGHTYPSALRKAVCQVFGEETAKIFDSPNNTLAVEYIRQSRKQKNSFEYLAIKRNGPDHLDEHVNHSCIATAGALRLIENVDMIKNYVPGPMFSELSSLEQCGLYPYKTENAERVLLGFLRQMSLKEMSKFVSDDSGLVNRLYKASKTAASFDDLIGKTKTKSITMAAVRRAVMSCFLKIPAEMPKALPPYVKVLAMNKKGAEIIKASKCCLPVISRHSHLSSLSEFGKEVYFLECSCTDLYSLFSKKISGCSREQTSPIFIAD